jgi:hypothetical protein
MLPQSNKFAFNDQPAILISNQARQRCRRAWSEVGTPI